MFKQYDADCPIRCKNVSLNSVRKPWISKNLQKLIEFKHVLFRSNRRKFIPDYVYNKFKTKLKKTIERHKIEYFRNLFGNSKSNVKSTWNAINKYFRQNSKQNRSKLVLNVNNSEVVSERDIVENFGDYFSKVATDLDEKIPPVTINATQYLDRPIIHELETIPASQSEVFKLIHSFETKSCMLNEIPV